MRSAHRTAISNYVLRKLNVVRVFLLAEIPEKEKYITQEGVESEHHHFDDIVQGNQTSISMMVMLMLIGNTNFNLRKHFHRQFRRSIPKSSVQAHYGSSMGKHIIA